MLDLARVRAPPLWNQALSTQSQYKLSDQRVGARDLPKGGARRWALPAAKRAVAMLVRVVTSPWSAGGLILRSHAVSYHAVTTQSYAILA
jgi:hypothetical protein